MSLDFAAVLTKMVEVRASDVHLTAGFPPALRVRGRIVPMDDYPQLGPQDTREIVYSILNDSQRKAFENQQQLDFAYAIPGVARFRVNTYFQRGAVSAAPGETVYSRIAPYISTVTPKATKLDVILMRFRPVPENEH